MCLFESLEGKDVSEQLSKEFQSQEQICVATAVAIICLIALTSRVKMDRRCALKEVKQSINQMGENSAFHI